MSPVFDMDRTERTQVKSGETTTVTLSLWLLFVEVVVFPFCALHDLVSIGFGFVSDWAMFLIEERSAIWDGVAAESRIYVQFSSCRVWLVMSFSSIHESLAQAKFPRGTCVIFYVLDLCGRCGWHAIRWRGYATCLHSRSVCLVRVTPQDMWKRNGFSGRAGSGVGASDTTVRPRLYLSLKLSLLPLCAF